MKIYIEYNPSVIRLKGDKEVEAVANYMYNRYGVITLDRYFACNFLMKYKADAKLFKYKDKIFFYPSWH